MTQLDPYLTFDGTCAEAMRFYASTLGGKIEMMMTHAESPMAAQTPAGSESRIMHARLALGDRILMASDSMVGMPYLGMHGFALSLMYPTVDEGRKVFDALATGGQVQMPFEKTFWAEGFGMLVDKFGTPWMVNCGMTQ
ncbi:MAG TPA: VOC family protein [Burkholderiaceae bacterium]|jgi:PhnB protein